jgi:ABC-type glycerol-3-phosphate transport system substrate-binding protein
MPRPFDRDLETLANEAASSGMKRVTFIKRALALGASIPAIAYALDALEGPASAHAASSSQVTINFGSWGSIDEQITANAILKTFQTRYPNIQVQPQYTDFTDYFVQLNANLAAKSIPDVMFLTYVPTYASKGALADVRTVAAKHGKKITGYTQGELFLFEWNGGLYGVPRDNDTKVIFYNRALFRKAGVPYPKDGWSYDDLSATAKKLTIGSGARISQYGYAFETPFWRLWLWENGVELFDNDANPTKATFNTPAGAQALQFMADLINVDHVTPPPSQMAGSATIAPLFASGQLAMAFGNHALVPTFNKTKGLDWFVVGMPHFAGHPVVNASGGAGYTISSFTKQQDAAWQLWDFLTGPVASLAFAAGDDIVPLSPAALASPSWNSKPYNKVFTAQTKLGHDFPSFAQIGPVLTAIDSALQPVWIGEETAAQALPKAAAAADKLLKP